MSDTRRFDDYNNEKKLHRISKQKRTRLDKHKKLIYDVVTSRKKDDDELDDIFEYGNFSKIKRR